MAGSPESHEAAAVPGFLNYPIPRPHHAPYKSPPAATNPVVRGVALHYGASLISSLSILQSYLWSNAGFTALRNIPGLTAAEARYDPTVTPIADSSASTAPKNTDPGSLRKPPADVAGRFYSVADYHAAYKSGNLTPTDVIESLLPLITRDVEKPTKHSLAFLETRVDFVKQAAEASTQRYKAGKPLGVLDGVPVAVKDELHLKGYSRSVGTKQDLRHGIDETSWCVEKWEEEGAIILGKLNMHELGLDTTNNNPNHGTPRNPFNDNYYTGGSSGGSGYVLGMGLVPIAHGADGGGSIRIPSQYCGVFGLKTTHGRVSGAPSASLASSTGVHGPMAANMTDLEIAYRVMAKPDPASPTSVQFPMPRPHTGGRNKVLGIYKTWFERADPIVQSTCQKAIDHLVTKHGYTVVDITIPHIHSGQLAHSMTILSEISSSHPDVSGLTPANKVLISVGSKTPAIDFLLAQRLRTILMEHLAYLFQQHPGLVIVTPTTPNAGWPIHGGEGDLKYGVSDANMSIRSMEYVWLANFTGLPSLAMPVGYVEPVMGEGKVPVGLMGTGEWGSEDALIEWGYDGESWLNQGLEGGRRRPEAWVDVLRLGKRR